MTRDIKNPVADHVTNPPACAETALVNGPLAGGAADPHPASLLQSTGSPSHCHGGATRKCRNEAPPKITPVGTGGIVIALALAGAAMTLITALVIAARYIF